MLKTFFSHRNRLLTGLIVSSAVLLLSGCGRKFSISVNDQMLYDPRPGTSGVVVADAGLQSCINVLMRQRGLTDVEQIQVLACPLLEIESLAGINQLVNLRFLDLAGNQLMNLDGLAGAKNLSSINAPDNRLQDISAILQIPTLSSAVMTGNQLIPCSQLEVLQAKLDNSLLAPERCMP